MRQQPLADRVLVRPGKSRVHQFPGIGRAGRHGHFHALLVNAYDLVQVGKIQARINALREQVHGHGHQVHIARALAVPEERALHALGAGQQRQFGGGHGGPPALWACTLKRIASRLEKRRDIHSIWSA